MGKYTGTQTEKNLLHRLQKKKVMTRLQRFLKKLP